MVSREFNRQYYSIRYILLRSHMLRVHQGRRKENRQLVKKKKESQMISSEAVIILTVMNTLLAFAWTSIAKIEFITAKIITLISYPQFNIRLTSYIISWLIHSSREHLNPQMTSSQHQWLHSSRWFERRTGILRSRFQTSLKSSSFQASPCNC